MLEQKHLWTFQPSEVKKYVFKPQCLAWPYNPKSNLLMQYASQHARKFVLRAVGEGSEGDIKVRLNFSIQQPHEQYT